MLSWAALDRGHPDVPLPAADYSAMDPPRLAILLRPDRLQLDGHTVSVDQEQALLQTAERLFAGLQTGASFRPLGTAPDYWAPVSLAVLDALSATRSANVLLTGEKVQIRGVAKNGWHEKADALRRTTGGVVALDVEMIIPNDAVRARHLCSRAVNAHRHGTVGFLESRDVLRSSARLELDRIISLADACRESTLSITGHTDSSGSEALNLELSLARAKAVAEYLVERGISPERLVTVGAGSSEPVASNETRYGRGLNRRIEIRLHDDPEMARRARE